MKDKVAGMQTGQRGVLQQDPIVVRVLAVHIEVDQLIVAAVYGRDMARKPGAEAILIARIERRICGFI